jgi:hypothetical protein
MWVPVIQWYLFGSVTVYTYHPCFGLVAGQDVNGENLIVIRAFMNEENAWQIGKARPIDRQAWSENLKSIFFNSNEFATEKYSFSILGRT